LLRRRREGLVFTKTANVLLESSRNALSVVGREMSRTRQAVLWDSDPRFEFTGQPGVKDSPSPARFAPRGLSYCLLRG
jgi:hypothetical protein